MSTITHISFPGSDAKTIIGSMHPCSSGGGTWVIFAHGLTGHRIGPHYLYVKIANALAEQGISSLRFDFTGSGESDGTFAQMTLTTMRHDLQAAISYLQTRHHPDRLVILGHSLGGTVAALSTAETEVNGLVLLAPVADPLGIKKRREQVISRGPNERGFYENGPHEMSTGFLEALAGIDPVSTMSANFKGHLLLFQGDADPSVSVEESGRYIKSAETSGIPATTRIFTGVDHNFTTVDSTRALLSFIPAWIRENLT